MSQDSRTAWELAGPLSDTSTRLLADLEVARANGEGEMDAWLAFFRSLSSVQQQAMLGLIETLDEPH